ncbi:dienelactone hydrolase family protein [Kocuria palustris]
MLRADAMMVGMSENPVVMWNRDPAESPEAPLLVLFHGYGSNEQDLMGLVPQLPQDFVVASVRAPLAQPPGYSWFPLYDEEAFGPDAIRAAVEPLVGWLREQAEGRPSTTLLGFSQGMSIATSLVRAMPSEITAVIGLSGFVVPEPLEIFRDDELKEKPFKLFWGRDPQDPIVNDQLVDMTAEWLVEHADTMKVHYQGIGHSVSPQEIGHVNEYLTRMVLGR